MERLLLNWKAEKEGERFPSTKLDPYDVYIVQTADGGFSIGTETNYDDFLIDDVESIKSIKVVDNDGLYVITANEEKFFVPHNDSGLLSAVYTHISTYRRDIYGLITVTIDDGKLQYCLEVDHIKKGIPYDKFCDRILKRSDHGWRIADKQFDDSKQEIRIPNFIRSEFLRGGTERWVNA